MKDNVLHPYHCQQDVSSTLQMDFYRPESFYLTMMAFIHEKITTLAMLRSLEKSLPMKGLCHL